MINVIYIYCQVADFQMWDYLLPDDQLLKVNNLTDQSRISD